MSKNTRILVVDDQEDLRMQVAKVLEQRPDQEAQSLIAQIRYRIGRGREPSGTSPRASYEVDTYSQGKEAYEGVKQAMAENKPYALMFLDMRMPPGWDGLETAQRIRTIDREMQIVIMTAYADYDQSEMAEKIGEPDKLLYIKKPFHPEEIRQLALALTEKWNLNRREKERLILTNRLMRENGYLTRQGFESLDTTYNSVLNAFVSFLDAESGVLVQRTGSDMVPLASSSPAATEALESLSDEERNSPRMITRETSGSALMPIIFSKFDGFIYLRGKGVNFTFEQLRPFLDILMETGRGVMRNAISMADHRPADEMGLIAPALGNLAEQYINTLNQTEALADRLCTETLSSAECSDLGGVLREQIAPLMRTNRRLQTLARVASMPLDLDRMDVVGILERAIAPHHKSADASGIEVSIDANDDLRLVADGELMQVALNELVDYSLSALRSTGPTTGRVLRLSAAYVNGDQQRLRILISENAAGMSEKQEQNLFKPFEFADDERNLAITIAQHVILRHRGTIRCENETGSGSSFQVILPVSGP